jgi:hypothetical protein
MLLMHTVSNCTIEIKFQTYFYSCVPNDDATTQSQPVVVSNKSTISSHRKYVSQIKSGKYDYMNASAS